MICETLTVEVSTPLAPQGGPAGVVRPPNVAR